MSLDDSVDLKESPRHSDTSTSKPLVLKAAMADYDRVRPLIDGRVAPEGIELDITTDDIREFCVRPVYEEFDVAEMSMTWYVAARSRGEPCIALPIFPLRMAVLGYIYCRTDAPYTHPSELVGKRIASDAYRYTVNAWLRGMLKDHYGLAPEQASWVTVEDEINGFVIPENIDVRVLHDRRPGELLIAGEVDAVLGPEPPDEFIAGDPRIRRLFPDARAESAAYFKKTGIYPVTHTVVVHEKLARDKPWVLKPLVDAFRESQRVCDAYYYDNAKCLSLPGGPFILEEERRTYGPEPYTQGVAANRHLVETFIGYAHEQGYIDRPLTIEEFFAENTLEL